MPKVIKNLIVLERGTDELLLANSFHLRPLYVQRGKERVKQILAAAMSGLKMKELQTAFAQDGALIRLLFDYRILNDGSSSQEVSSQPANRTKSVKRHDKNRITLYLLLTEACNLKCVYCLNGSQTYGKNVQATMSAQTALHAVAMCLKDLITGGTAEVAFFGGEPLLKWALIKEVIRRCENELKPTYTDKHIHYHLTSNLTVMPPDLVEWVTRYNIKVLCGIDGPPEIHDRCRTYPGGGATHAKSAETIRQLVQAGASVTLRATITSANQDHLAEVAVHHSDMGAESSLFIPVRPINSDQDFFPEEILPDPNKIITAALELGRSDQRGKANLFPFNDFSGEIRPGVRYEVACGAPHGTTYVVRTNGDVYPCIYLVGQEEYYLGNVTGDLDYRPLDTMLKVLHVDNREDCQTCVWRYACGGGCPVMHLARVRGAAKNSKVAEYSRRITCDLSQAILADGLWSMADRVRADNFKKNEI